MRSLLSISIFLLVLSSVQAQAPVQGQLSGRVFDADTRQPLPFAAVTV
jgi:hypothetical protein